MAASPQQRAQFRALYLVGGVASRAAREVGVSVGTGLAWAKALRLDADFLKERDELQSSLTAEITSMVAEMAQTAAERFQGDLITITKITPDGEQDAVAENRTPYGGLLVKALDVLLRARAAETPTLPGQSGPLVQVITASEAVSDGVRVFGSVADGAEGAGSPGESGP